MSGENKRKAQHSQDGGPEAKFKREANENGFCSEAQTLLDQKIAEGTVCDLHRRS
jgi:hypothetical protein